MQNPGDMLRAALTMLCLMCVASGASAFDYRDGSAVRDHGGDLASLYAFVPDVGGEPGPLTVALAIKPFALSVAEVGKDTEYLIRIRRAGLAGSGDRLRTRLGKSELRIACHYYDNDYEIACFAVQVGADGSERVLAALDGDIGQTMQTKGLKIVTQMRSDPAMTNFRSQWFCLDDIEKEFLATPDEFERRVHVKFRNSIEVRKMNVVGLIAEIDRSWLPEEPGLPLAAVAAQSVDIDKDGKRTPIDRVGRPGTSMFLIQDDTARNGWNQLDPFDEVGATAFRKPMQMGLEAVDTHSRMDYWNRPHPLLELLLNDHLLLNPNVPAPVTDTSRNLYFEIEWAAYNDRSIDGLAGGRRLVDNVVSRFFAVMARQGQSHFAHLEALRHPLYRQTHAQFPYMAAPYEKLDTLYGRAAEEMNPFPPAVRGCE
ncbi:MAG: hypothetical protein AAF458_00775 [Pseudomonadota bacterium]